jgi:hypothetical protein
MHLERRAVLPALLLLAALLTPLGTVGAAAAAEPAWQAPHHLPQPAEVLGRSISCPKATWCMAVDSLGHGQRFDGTRWRTPSPASHHYGFLNDVSCPTTHFCMAVGPYGYVVHRSAGWSRPRVLPIVGGAVSCTSEKFCLVVDSTGHSARWNGRRWGQVRLVDRHHPMVRVSCGSPTMCLASGTTGQSYRYGGHGWTPAGRPFAGSKWEQEGLALSCVSRTWCFGTSVSPGRHHWAVYDGRHWGRAHRLAGKGRTAAVSCAGHRFCVVASGHQLTAWHGRGSGHAATLGAHYVPLSVACGGTGHCVASGIGHAYEPNNDRSYALRHGHWRRLNDTHATDPDRGVGVSCATESWCMVATGSRRTWVHDGDSWTRELLPDNPPATGSNPPPAHLSCPSADFCALLQHNVLHTWDGTTWSVATEVAGATWQDVSCGGPTMCLAVGMDSAFHGVTSEWNGTSWGAATAVPGGSPELLTVSCATVDHCVAGDEVGEALTVDHDTWSRVDAIVPDDETEHLHSLSCPTTTFCMVDSLTSGRVAVFHDDAWHIVSGAPVGSGGSFSCPTEGHCTVALRSETQMESWDYTVDSGFTHRQRIDPPAYGRRSPVVSCAGPTYCLAVDGEVSTFERR